MGREIRADLVFSRPTNLKEIRKHVPVSAGGSFEGNSWSFSFSGSSFAEAFARGLPGLVKAMGPIEGTIETDACRFRVSRTGLLRGWTSKTSIIWAVCPGCGTRVSGKEVCFLCKWEKMLAREKEWEEKCAELGPEKLVELDGECKCHRGKTIRIPCQCGELHCKGCYTGELEGAEFCKYAVYKGEK